MYTYIPLTNTTFEEIHEAFGKAFADYVVPFNMSLEDLIFMIERRGYNPDISFGAFFNDELVGFTLNGSGLWNGNPTAYDTGTGVVKEHRQKGIAKQIFLESIPVLAENKIEQYILEVIDTNKPAIELYKKMGFEETRKFDFQIPKIEDVNFSKLNNEISFKVSGEADWEKFKLFWNNEPSWQNSIDSIERKQDAFIIISAEYNNETAGYGIIQKSNGDIPQRAVKKEFRRKRIGSAILNELGKYSESGKFRFINTIQDDADTLEFFKKLDIKKEGGQFEMIKKL